MFSVAVKAIRGGYNNHPPSGSHKAATADFLYVVPVFDFFEKGPLIAVVEWNKHHPLSGIRLGKEVIVKHASGWEANKIKR